MISARGVVFDTAGNLLVVRAVRASTAHTLDWLRLYRVQ